MYKVCFRMLGQHFHKSFESEAAAREFAQKSSKIVGKTHLRERDEKGFCKYITLETYKSGKLVEGE